MTALIPSVILPGRGSFGPPPLVDEVVDSNSNGNGSFAGRFSSYTAILAVFANGDPQEEKMSSVLSTATKQVLFSHTTFL